MITVLPRLPEPEAIPVGYAALVKKYDLETPIPTSLCAIGAKHKRYDAAPWKVFTPRHNVRDSLAGHLTFALKYEGLDLLLLNRLFAKVSPGKIEEIVRDEPTGSYSRRVWFLYEWLRDTELDLPEVKMGNFVDVLDPKLQYPGPSRPSRRQRVNNNLPGVLGFCPLVRRTDTIEKLIQEDIPTKVREIVRRVPLDIVKRAAAFLLLEDSQASFLIEGETPPRNRAERWARIVGLAGKIELSMERLEVLQKEVLDEKSHVKLGLRKDGGFIGTRDRITQAPLPSHVSAKPEDVRPLVKRLLETEALLKAVDYPPVLVAAAIGFGFVFIHPFEDGNGRIHRYLLHHTLADSGFTPENVVFPVSSVILERIDKYKSVLESFSGPRLPFIEWRPTAKLNVEVLNETVDLYAYFDATALSEFFYECVKETAEHNLPEEMAFLQKFDAAKAFITGFIDISDERASLLVSFLHQNGGTLSGRARKKEFKDLNEEEVRAIEERFSAVFAPDHEE